MKKKISNLTFNDASYICSNYEQCSKCPLNYNNCLSLFLNHRKLYGESVVNVPNKKGKFIIVCHL